MILSKELLALSEHVILIEARDVKWYLLRHAATIFRTATPRGAAIAPASQHVRLTIGLYLNARTSELGIATIAKEEIFPYGEDERRT